MEIRIKPCPFCYGEPKIFSAFGTHVECRKCGARIYDFDMDKAIKKWNRRYVQRAKNE